MRARIDVLSLFPKYPAEAGSMRKNGAVLESNCQNCLHFPTARGRLAAESHRAELIDMIDLRDVRMGGSKLRGVRASIFHQ